MPRNTARKKIEIMENWFRVESVRLINWQHAANIKDRVRWYVLCGVCWALCACGQTGEGTDERQTEPCTLISYNCSCCQPLLVFLLFLLFVNLKIVSEWGIWMAFRSVYHTRPAHATFFPGNRCANANGKQVTVPWMGSARPFVCLDCVFRIYLKLLRNKLKFVFIENFRQTLNV